jgi:hypothetical protein
VEWATRSIGGAVLIVVAVAGCTTGESGAPVPLPTSTTSVPPSTSTSFDDGTCRFGYVPSTGRVTDRSDETGWVEADPLDHEVDGPQLHEALDELVKLSGIYSFLVARHGVLVIERYFNGAARSHSREIASASKSIMSALVGIAIEREPSSESTIRSRPCFPKPSRVAPTLIRRTCGCGLCSPCLADSPMNQQ